MVTGATASFIYSVYLLNRLIYRVPLNNVPVTSECDWKATS